MTSLSPGANNSERNIALSSAELFPIIIHSFLLYRSGLGGQVRALIDVCQPFEEQVMQTVLKTVDK